MTLTSFGTSFEAVVIGASGGIGGAFTARLASDPSVSKVHAISREGRAITPHPKVVGHTYDPRDEGTIEQVCDSFPADVVRLAICTIGTLHDGVRGPEKSLRDLNAADMEEVFRVNAFLPALFAKHLAGTLRLPGRRVFAALSARVGSISDNRLGGWYSYRASKSALNQFIRTASVEVARRNPEAVLVTLHPGTVDTALSQPFQKNVPSEKLFTPEHSAAAMLDVIDALTPSRTGHCFDYSGAEVPS